MNRVRTELKERGFSLIEVIVAVTVISIGLLAILPLLITSIKAETQIPYRVRAQYAVTQRMDQLISQTPACDNITSTDFIDAQTGQVLNAPSAPVVITRNWTVGFPALSSLCTITVNVTYTDQGGTKTLSAYSQKGT